MHYRISNYGENSCRSPDRPVSIHPGQRLGIDMTRRRAFSGRRGKGKKRAEFFGEDTGKKTKSSHTQYDFRAVTPRSSGIVKPYGVGEALRIYGDLRNLLGVSRQLRIESIEVFRNASKDIPDARFLAQGTLYPDVIESGQGFAGRADTIKGHHNVWGLPDELGFELIEPLRDLFKDEVRVVGEHLGLPEEIVWRHPFPGPGLAVRVAGAITPERLEKLRQADEILLEEIRAANLYRSTGQVFAVLLPISAVGVMGDGRSYESSEVIVIRAVETTDFMTADWVHLPYEVLGLVSNRIMNEVPGINRVAYDISSKPPATIEWE